LPHVLIEIYEDLTINMKLVKILDHIVKELRNKKVVLVRVLWKNSKKKKDLGKRVGDNKKYVSLFSNTSMNLNFRNKIYLEGQNINP
jgi:hypothetical protein